MDAMFTFSEEELNAVAGHSHDDSSNSSPSTSTMLTTENLGRPTIKRPTSLNVIKPTELVLRDSTNAGCKSEGSPINSVQKRQQKKKKRRTANSYSDISFNDKYKLTEELLGTGAHGVVKTCRDRVTKQEYAVKIISKARHPNRTRVFKEIDIYYHCRGCENILSIIDFLEDDDYFYLVFQKMEGGPLLNHIMKRGRLTEREASLIVRDIANGLNFMHSKGMSHRDLKPENILVERADSLVSIKLCDFDLGSAIRLNSNKTTPITTPELSTPVGSVEFMAPEVVDAWRSLEGSSQIYDKRCDLWSLGVIIYIMLSGYPPFYGTCGHTCGWTKGEECEQCQSLLFERIQDGEFDFPDKDWQHITEGAKDLIKRLLVRDASLRLTAAEVLEHPWVKNSHELNERPLNTPELLQRHDSIRRLESFTKDALSITKMIGERERMMYNRSRSIDSIPQRSRRRSIEPPHPYHRENHDDNDDDADDDDDFNESDSSVTRILKRRMRKKKKQQNKNPPTNADDDNQNFDNLRRRLSSATMTSGDEEDYLACSFKTVIHRPAVPMVPPPPPIPPPPHFYLAPTDNPSQLVIQSEITAQTPSPSIPAPPPPLPVLVLPSPPVNLPIHHRAHTDTDLLFYNQQPLVYPVHWYPPPTFIYPNQSTPPANFVYGPLPPFVMHPIPQQQVRSSSADCRRTANNGNEHRVIHPERVW
jgi:MAP kinase interacting serine/threonine kinase